MIDQPDRVDVDSYLRRFEQFGVHLGLERIQQLLACLGNPQRQIPIIHVAGTNGKGSVCAYLSAVLTQAGYRVGRYTSPHLVDWSERICLNQQPITQVDLQHLLWQVQQAIQADASPTQFEVITAAAWLYFAQQRVDVAVVEVGLGGRLDATNVCNHPLVSVITSISREHWQVLGPTLADIAREKAGILKPRCPAIIGPMPPEAKSMIVQRATELDCPTVWPQPAQDLGNGWAESQGMQYPLSLQGAIQRTNSALAITTLQTLRQQGWQIPQAAIVTGMAHTDWPGRLQWTTWHEHPLLLDGAHNVAAAQVLRQFVDHSLGDSPCEIHWIIGMLATKDHADILRALLRPGESVYLVPVPDSNSANPNDLAILASEICPDLACQIYPDLMAGLEAAVQIAEHVDPGWIDLKLTGYVLRTGYANGRAGSGRAGLKPAPTAPTVPLNRLTVLCGSLYLVGHFLRHQARA